MFKSITFALLGAIAVSTLSGCVVYPHRHYDDVVVEPAGYRYHEGDRDWHDRDRGYRDHDREWDRHY